jgi:hypothetical protein
MDNLEVKMVEEMVDYMKWKNAISVDLIKDIGVTVQVSNVSLSLVNF